MSGYRLTSRARRGLGLTVVVVVHALLGAACTTTTTVAYVPEPERPRLTWEEARLTVVRFASIECPRLIQDGLGAGEVQVLARVGPGGLTREAELEGTSRDERLDGILGAVVAQLAFADEYPDGGDARVRIFYRCGPPVSVRFARR